VPRKQDWSPREEARRLSKAEKERGKLIPRMEWDFEEWRRPDRHLEGGKLLIWYGPGDREGEHATVVEWTGDGWTVSEYQGVEGVIDNPPAPFLVTSTEVSRDTLYRAAIEQSRGPASATSPRGEIGRLGRWAASVGVALLSYYGGDESWEDQLP